MANGIKYQSHEILNKVLNTAETGLQVDIVAGAEYAEDSGHSSTDTGNFILGVRNDTLAALGGTDGDYVPFQMNASGALYVEVASTVHPAGFASIGHGNNTAVGTSAEVLASSQACKHIDVMAAIANTGIIYVGGSGVTAATGIALYAGDVYSVDIDNVNNIYVLASVDGEDVAYVYYN